MNADDSIAVRTELLERLKNRGEQTGWQEFFDAYWQLIYRVAKKAGLSDTEAQEIVVETVASVAKKAVGFRYDPARCSFKTWMLRLTRWRIIDQLRKRMCREPARSIAGDDTIRSAAFEQGPNPAGGGLESVWNAEWERTVRDLAVEKIRRQVNPEQFQMFDLYAEKHMPIAQVARMMGVGVARVYLTKHRVASLIKREIKQLEARMA